MQQKSHWEEVYRVKAPTEVSWYQPQATNSLELIRAVLPDKAGVIIDVGGGASVLVGDLLGAGYQALTVLDLSGAALGEVQRRLGEQARCVQWLEADVLEVWLPAAAFDVWHDRAVFHFLTSVKERQRYVAQLRHALRPGGHVVMATFAQGGPSRCSGLDVQRYTPESLQAALGEDFQLLRDEAEVHVTPAGKQQAFIYCIFAMA